MHILNFYLKSKISYLFIYIISTNNRKLVVGILIDYYQSINDKYTQASISLHNWKNLLLTFFHIYLHVSHYKEKEKKKNWLYIKYTEAIFCGGSTGISIMYIWMTRHENRYQVHVILKNGSWKRTPNAKECMYINSFRSILPSLINWIDEIFMTRIILLELFIFIIRLFLSRKKLEEN